tara:strand:- start:185 stop:688 length:504 start_codon:yes stop_codon:yes gene_type:complete
MTSDIDEMEKMLSDYLQYAKSQAEENSTKINLSDLITEILRNYGKNKYEFEKSEIIEIEGRKNLIKRCIINIIGNGLAYGDKIKIQIKKSINGGIIIIEDDGPGIPEGEFLNVFKPFYRIDKSRGLNKSGVGLGLSIAQDIVKSHGGNITLSKSKMGGLLVKISLPF